jgi:hypothetical protein
MQRAVLKNILLMILTLCDCVGPSAVSLAQSGAKLPQGIAGITLGMSEEEFVRLGGEKVLPSVHGHDKPFYWKRVEVFGENSWAAQPYFDSSGTLTILTLHNALSYEVDGSDGSLEDKYLTVSASFQYPKRECDLKFEQLAVGLGKTYKRFDARPEVHVRPAQMGFPEITDRSAKMTFADRVLTLNGWWWRNVGIECHLSISFALKAKGGGFQ